MAPLSLRSPLPCSLDKKDFCCSSQSGLRGLLPAFQAKDRALYPSAISLGTPNRQHVSPRSLEYKLQRTYRGAAHICFVATSEGALADVDIDKNEVLSEADSSLVPTSYEIQSLLTEICSDTKIAEFRIKTGSFSLNMKRNVGKGHEMQAAPSIAPPPITKSSESAPPMPSSTKLAKKPSIDPSVLSPAISKAMSLFGLLEGAADEGVQFITSPKVGLFRRGRTVKGKEGPPMCQEGQIIKQGQVLCYIEQLGTQTPVEAEDNGEVVRILWKDGEPIGYGDPLVVVQPTFPGILKLT